LIPLLKKGARFGFAPIKYSQKRAEHQTEPSYIPDLLSDKKCFSITDYHIAGVLRGIVFWCSISQSDSKKRHIQGDI
jgi:hypothetical protein